MRPRRSRRRCRGRQREAGLACAPALGAGGRAVSPQPPRPRLDWRLPRARLMGGRGRWRADCAPGGRRSRSAPQPGRRGGRLVRAKRDMARKPISPGGPVSTGRGYTLAGQPLASWGRAARGLHFPGRQAGSSGSDVIGAQYAGARAALVYIRKVRHLSCPFVPEAP